MYRKLSSGAYDLARTFDYPSSGPAPADAATAGTPRPAPAGPELPELAAIIQPDPRRMPPRVTAADAPAAEPVSPASPGRIEWIIHGLVALCAMLFGVYLIADQALQARPDTSEPRSLALAGLVIFGLILVRALIYAWQIGRPVTAPVRSPVQD